MFARDKKVTLPDQDEALPGRDQPMPIPETHFVNGNPLKGPFAENLQQAVFAMGCFWGVERIFWQTPGVFTTAVGYAGGLTPNPDYQEVCGGFTGHTEVVLVVFDTAQISYEQLLKIFGKATIRHRACVRATTSALSTDPPYSLIRMSRRYWPSSLTTCISPSCASRGTAP